MLPLLDWTARPQCSRCQRRRIPQWNPGVIADGDYELYEPVPGMNGITGLCAECLQLTCPDCARRYTATVGHCRGGRYTGCCRSFRTEQDAERHRVRGRCQTDAELTAKGWIQEGDFWLSPNALKARQRAQKV